MDRMLPAKWACLLLALVVVGATGCATVTSGRYAEVSIKSNPEGARVDVRNEEGETVVTSKTPATVQLKRSNGIFRKAPRYTATIQKPGFQPTRVAINPKVNPWIVGNLALGGVAGFGADYATGAMWRYSPNQIEKKLSPFESPTYSQTEGEELVQVSYVSDE